jgi:hypothetical protein
VVNESWFSCHQSNALASYIWWSNPRHNSSSVTNFVVVREDKISSVHLSLYEMRVLAAQNAMMLLYLFLVEIKLLSVIYYISQWFSHMILIFIEIACLLKSDFSSSHHIYNSHSLSYLLSLLSYCERRRHKAINFMVVALQ